MKARIFTCALIGLLISSQSYSAGTTHWGYTGDIGPTHWGKLSPEFETCSSGRNQSPIDLTGMVEGDLAKLNLDYKTGGHKVINNGHTIKVQFAPGSTMTVSDQNYELKQVHYHSPSENTVDGKFYPLEAHFVHADKAGNLAVVALFYKYGDADKELNKAWVDMPQAAGKQNQLYDHIDAAKLLPGSNDYYRFNGSLTTPPCTEGVKWFVLKEVATVSKEQVKKFADIMGHDNNRPVQPINARVVIQ